MRKDIMIDTNTGAFIHPDNNKRRDVYRATRIEEMEAGMLHKYVYFEVVGKNIRLNKPIHLKLQYTPVMTQAYIRIGNVDDSGRVVFLRNPKNQSLWYPIMMLGKHDYVSKLPLINKDGEFTVMYNQNTSGVDFYSLSEFDFLVDGSAYQDAKVLINANKGSIYRFPTAGVGIHGFLHSSIDDSLLGSEIQRELNDDGMYVNNLIIANTDTVKLDINEINRGYDDGEKNK